MRRTANIGKKIHGVASVIPLASVLVENLFSNLMQKRKSTLKLANLLLDKMNLQNALSLENFATGGNGSIVLLNIDVTTIVIHGVWVTMVVGNHLKIL